MSSNDWASTTARTVVPQNLDAVGQARAELKAALAAIEEKANVPKRMGRAVDTYVDKARTLAQEHPLVMVGLVVVAAAAAGLAVWGAVRAYTR